MDLFLEVVGIAALALEFEQEAASEVRSALLGGDLGDAKSCPRSDPRGSVGGGREAGGLLEVAECLLCTVACREK